MIISFYDKDFRGLQDNASLVIDNNSYSLIKRGVDLDELKCTCEPFTENIQPAFLVVKNDRGNYVYACLAGIPELTKERKTVITGTDIKSMLKSDVLIELPNNLETVADLLDFVFNAWKTQVNQNSFDCVLEYKKYTQEGVSIGAADMPLTDLKHEVNNIYDVWEDIFAPYLKFYGLYMTTHLKLILDPQTKKGKVIFEVGRSMYRDLNIKLWEHGIYDYGKWVASVNETQGYVHNTANNSFIDHDYRWILRSDNVITSNSANRDIYPIKRRIVLKETDDSTKVAELLIEANTEALKLLCNSLYNEDITLSGVNADFETNFKITLRKGEGIYKSLPCGELHYDASSEEYFDNGVRKYKPKKVQIGYRFTGLQFIL